MLLILCTWKIMSCSMFLLVGITTTCENIMCGIMYENIAPEVNSYKKKIYINLEWTFISSNTCFPHFFIYLFIFDLKKLLCGFRGSLYPKLNIFYRCINTNMLIFFFFKTSHFPAKGGKACKKCQIPAEKNIFRQFIFMRK